MSNQSILLYKAELVRCHNFLFGTVHDNSNNFSNNKLFELAPEYIYSYLIFKVFGRSTPSESNKATEGRPSIIEYTKTGNFLFHDKQAHEMGFAKQLQKCNKIYDCE